jgi:hypothetical protein
MSLLDNVNTCILAPRSFKNESEVLWPTPNSTLFSFQAIARRFRIGDVAQDDSISCPRAADSINDWSRYYHKSFRIQLLP